jgi:DNA-binding MarR family transcriptional regulator
MGSIIKERMKLAKFKSVEHEALLSMLVASSALRAKQEKIAVQNKITPTQFLVLRILKEAHPNGLARYEILSRLIDAQPDVTRIIDRLVEAKLAERITTDEDKRQSLARLTKKGLKVVTDMEGQMDEFDNLLKGKISKKDSQVLTAICEKILDSLD